MAEQLSLDYTPVKVRVAVSKLLYELLSQLNLILIIFYLILIELGLLNRILAVFTDGRKEKRVEDDFQCLAVCVWQPSSEFCIIASHIRW